MQPCQDPRNRSLLQSTNELLILVNRVNLLQIERERTEKRNTNTIQKTNRILSIKQNSISLNKKLNEVKLFNEVLNQRKHSMVEIPNKDFKRQKKINYNQEKKDEKQIIEESIGQYDIELKIHKSWMIKEKNIAQKDQLQKFWKEKLFQFAQEKNIEKMKQNQRCMLQNQSILKLEQLELNMIEMLQKSQQINQVLNKQLEDVKILPQVKFLEAYPEINPPQVQKIYHIPVTSRYLNPQNYNQFPSGIKFPSVENKKDINNQHWDDSRNLSIKQKSTLLKIYSVPMTISYLTDSNQIQSDRTHNAQEGKQHKFIQKQSNKKDDSNRQKNTPQNHQQITFSKDLMDGRFFIQQEQFLEQDENQDQNHFVGKKELDQEEQEGQVISNIEANVL